MIKAIIFDCFGVIYKDNFRELYTFFGGDIVKDHDLVEKAYFDASKGIIESGINVIAPHLGISEDQWRQEEDKFRGYNLELLEYIDQLRKTYKVSLLSNVGNKGLSYYMDYSVLEKHFDDIVESAKIGFAKPEAEAYEIAADRLGVRLDECVFIDDRLGYVEGAQAVGMKAMVFISTEQLKADLSIILKTS